MKRNDLEGLSREELVAKAEGLGVVRPKTLTMPELVDEILVAGEKKTGHKQKKARGWFGRARDLLTSVVDRGLADPTLGRSTTRQAPTVKAPLPTVTLAEIYAAQGHFERALTTLDEVLARDPEHPEAQRLRERFHEQARRVRASAPPLAGVPRPATVPPPPGLPDIRSAAGSARVDAKSSAGSSSATTSGEATSHASAGATGSASSEGAPIDPDLAAAPDSIGERYDVDEVVAIAVDPHTVYVYWEVRPTTLAEARAKAPDGALTLRVVTVEPRSSGPLSTAKDIRVDALFGEVFLRDAPANAEVRVTIGWRSSTSTSPVGRAAGVPDFVPLAVGLDLATPRELPTHEVARRFARADVSEVADTHGGFRAVAPAAGHRSVFGRSTPEEMALGHGAASGSDGNHTLEGPFIRTSEVVLGDGRRVRIEKRTVRAGASELVREEVRFHGASDRLAREHRVGSSELSRSGGREPLSVALGG